MWSQYTVHLFIHVNYKHLNYTKCANDNSTAVHFLGHKGKKSIFLSKGWNKTEKGKKAQKHTKI